MRKSWVTYLLGSLNLLLIFLSVFSSYLDLPLWLKWSGRLHPMILHFPIALILLTGVISIRSSASSENTRTVNFLMGLSALTAATSALLGLFLSTGGDYDPGLIQKHLWLGVGTSLLAFVAWLFRGLMFWRKFILILILPLLLVGSHYGASLTHGEDYLAWPEGELAEKQVRITDSTAIFAALVEPILASKCYACHNEKKAKGQLIMTSVVQLLKGGKTGPLWVAGDPLNSHILQRLELPEDDKKHMPPRGKPQLSAQEIMMLQTWISGGAEMQKRFMDYPSTDSLGIVFRSLIPKETVEKTYAFAAADPSLVKKLRTPFCDVSPLAIGSPALAVRFTIRSAFSSSSLKTILPLAEQVVELSLNGMPVTNQDLDLLKTFKHLEVLNLSNTNIEGKSIQVLAGLPALKTVSFSGTGVNITALKQLASAPELRQVFAWNTTASKEDTSALKKLTPGIQWEFGNTPDPKDLVRLTPPQMAEKDNLVLTKGSTVALKHPMPGVQIRYTLDGSPPDSLRSPIYNTPIPVTHVSQIRAIATRPGWLTSDTMEQTIFIRSAVPMSARLLTRPDSNYKDRGIASVLDGVKGDLNNLKEGWLGYHGDVCEMFFQFSSSQTISEVVVSTLKRTGPHILPPQRIELWAGNDSIKMKQIYAVNPLQPKGYERDRIEPQIMPIQDSYRYFKIRVIPLKALPKWHDSKGKKVWIFVDEVFFN